MKGTDLAAAADASGQPLLKPSIRNDRRSCDSLAGRSKAMKLANKQPERQRWCIL
jgi:hypothetical protein